MTSKPKQTRLSHASFKHLRTLPLSLSISHTEPYYSLYLITVTSTQTTASYHTLTLSLSHFHNRHHFIFSFFSRLLLPSVRPSLASTTTRRIQLFVVLAGNGCANANDDDHDDVDDGAAVRTR